MLLSRVSGPLSRMKRKLASLSDCRRVLLRLDSSTRSLVFLCKKRKREPGIVGRVLDESFASAHAENTPPAPDEGKVQVHEVNLNRTGRVGFRLIEDRVGVLVEPVDDQLIPVRHRTIKNVLDLWSAGREGMRMRERAARHA